MSVLLRWTTADLDMFPDDGKRREIIDGELYVSKQPHWHHQAICTRLATTLQNWSTATGAGVAAQAPGVIFAQDEAIAPDVVWISHIQLAAALGKDGKLHLAPELVVEVVSPGTDNELRDRDTKLKLYSRRGVREYWIVDWSVRQVDVYRRQEAMLHHVVTLYENDALTSPLLPGFICRVGELFEGTKD